MAQIPTVGGSPAPRIQPASFTITDSASRQRYLKALVYGAYGSGKTTLASSVEYVPNMLDALYIDAESGDMSIEDCNVDVVHVGLYAQFARVYEFLRTHCQLRDLGDEEALTKLEGQFRGKYVDGRFVPAVVTKPKHYMTAVIDSLTEIQKMAMYQLMGVKVGQVPLDMEPDNPQFKEWGQSAEMIRLLVRSFRNLPMNVIFVCAEQIVQDERKQLHRLPALPGKLAKEVQGFLDVVGYLVAAPNENQPGVVNRRLYLLPGRTYDAKHRFKHFKEAFIDEPTMSKIIEAKQRTA